MFTFYSTEDDGARISYKFCYVCTKLYGVTTQQMIIIVLLASGVPRGVWGVQNPTLNSEGPPKSSQT